MSWPEKNLATGKFRMTVLKSKAKKNGNVSVAAEQKDMYLRVIFFQGIQKAAAVTPGSVPDEEL